MSGIKISALPVATLPLSGNEVLPVVQSGNTVQVAAKNVYAGSSGSAQMGFIASGTGAAARTVQAKLRDVVSVKDFGAVGDGSTDDTVAVQAAITAAGATGGGFKVYFPAGTYKLSSALNVTSAVQLAGAGVSPYNAALGTRGGGTWLYFNHTGKGINIAGAAVLSGVELTDFGTYRNQPAPAPGWTPNAHDYDIYIDNADVLINDLMLLNPTKGVYLTNGNYGRLEINTLRGQAFQTMVRVYTSYDVVKINNLHQWPFWQDNSDVHAYTQQNLDVIYSERNDNPMFTNIFSIFARSGMRFGQNANGATSKVHAVNLDFDRGKFAVYVDTSVTNGVTGQIENLTHQGETGLAESKAIIVAGSNSALNFGLFQTDYCNQNAVRVESTGNTLVFAAPPRISNYDQVGAGFPAIEALNGNTIRIDGYPLISAGGGIGGRYSTTGTIYVDEWRSTTPTVTSGTGTITALGTVSGQYKVWNNTFQFIYDITITTNGTAGTEIRATLPSIALSGLAVANGREVVVSGVALFGQLNSALNYVEIRKYDNTYPGANGARLIVNGAIKTA